MRGLILSEVVLGAPPIARAFPRRNRIVSGLTAASWSSRRPPGPAR